MDIVLGIAVDDDAILRELLLDEHLPLDHKVPAGVARALAHPRQLRIAPPVQDTFIRAEHNRHSADGDAAPTGPRRILRCVPTVYSTSTFTGAKQMMSRSRRA